MATQYGNDTNETLQGTIDGDSLYGNGGDDTLEGLAGDDSLYGGSGNDTLRGGEGNDGLDGGGGEDSLDGGDDRISTYTYDQADRVVASGGTGRDTYVAYAYNSGRVSITDFSPGAGGDWIDINNLLNSSSGYTDGDNPFDPALGYLRLAQSGTDALLQWDGSGTTYTGDNWTTVLVLKNIDLTATPLTGDNFLPAMVDLGGIATNQAPTITGSPVADLAGTAGIPLGDYYVGSGFSDPDSQDRLLYSASLADGSPLPAGLRFDAVNNRFGGTPSEAGSYDIRVTATDFGGLAVSDDFVLTVAANLPPTAIQFQAGIGGLPLGEVYEEIPAGSAMGILSAVDTESGDPHAFRLVAGAGDTDNASFQIQGDRLLLAPGAGLDFETQPTRQIRVQATDGAGNSYEQALTLNLVDIREPTTTLYNGLGGEAGFGENQLGRIDDSPSSPAIDIGSVFEDGINYFGTTYTGFYVNNNGNLTFGQSQTAYNPYAIDGTTSVPIIAAFFTDIDTRAGNIFGSPGGNSTGSNLVYWDLDPQNNTVTVTWDDVGEYSQRTVPNAFQVRLTDLGGGDFSMEYRYESIDWNHGNARAGWSAGDGINYYEFAGSGTASMLDLEQQGNSGQGGLFTFVVSEGVPYSSLRVNRPIDDVRIDEDSPFTLGIPADTIVGQDPLATIAYSATLKGGLPLPGWLSFDPATRTFSGTPDDPDVGAVTVRVRAADGDGHYGFEDFTITVADVPDAPTGIRVDGAGIDEGPVLAGAVLGTLSAIDQDADDTHTFALLDDADGRVALVGDELRVASDAQFDFEQGADNTVTVRTTDSTGLSYEQTLALPIRNVNEQPTGIALSGGDIDENSAAGSVVGNLSTLDPDSADSYTYELIDDAGGRFALSGAQLRVADGTLLDYERDTSHTVRVRSTDAGGLSVERELTVNVVNIDGDLSVSQVSITPPVTQVESGTALDVTWTLVNHGEADYTGGWTDRVWLDDPNTEGLDRWVGDFPFSGVIALNTPLARTQTLAIPAELVGDYRVVVTTDIHNQVPEGSVGETDNTTAGTETVEVVPLPTPNLQVSSVTAPPAGYAGRPVEIEWTVTNAGTAPTNSPVWYDRIWLSTDGLLSGDDIALGVAENPGYLDSGQSYVNTATVTLPGVVPLDYRILVQTDAYGQIFELGNETDNVHASDTIDVQPIPEDQQSDLTVAAVGAPGLALSGQRMSLTYTIDNIGQAAIAAHAPEWIEQIYMSSDTDLDSGDRLLGTIQRTLDAADLPQPGGATHFTTTESLTLPVGVAGDFYFLVKVSPVAPVTDFLGTNDTGRANAPTTVTLTPPPDLQVTGIDAPTAALAGHNLTVTFQVANNGATVTPNDRWQDALYLSLDGTLDAADLKLSENWHFGALNPDGGYTSTVNYTLPSGLSGSYQLIAATDSANAVFELDNDNNVLVRTTAIAIESHPADLTVTAASAPGVIQGGKSFPITWTAANQGVGDTATERWNDAVILSKDDILGNADDQTLGSFPHSGLLGPGGEYSATALVDLPAGLSGPYRLFVSTDSGQAVYEGEREDNNGKAAGGGDGQPDPVVTVIDRPPADLRVATVTAPTTAASGQPIAVQYHIDNIGQGRAGADYWHDDIVLSKDDTLGNADDVALGKVLHNGGLDPAQGYDGSASFALPIDLAGDYRVFVRADASGSVEEGDAEDNNATAAVDPLRVALSPTPDLTLENLQAPNQGIAGQNLAVSWNIHNGGEAAAEGGWRQVFYLSRDQILDRDSDIYLGYADSAAALGAGLSAPDLAHDFQIPNGVAGRYYLLGMVDSGDAVYERGGEGNNIALDATPVQIGLPTPADLVADGFVTIPANGVPGQTASIDYSVTNQSAVAIAGAWHDSLYLSADRTWDIGDSLFARVDVDGPLNGGASYTATATGVLPGIAAGDYYLIVRSDIKNQVPETDEANNLKASLETTRLDIEALTLGTADAGTLDQGRAVFYRVDVEAGQTLRFDFDSAANGGRTELYVGYGELPSRSSFDYRYTLADSPDQSITVPNTAAGTYYVMAFGDAVPGGSDAYTMTAALLPFAAESLSLARAGNAGQATFSVNGSKFDALTQVELIHDGVVLTPTWSRVVDSTRIDATFDLTGVAPGAYDVRVVSEQDIADVVTDAGAGTAEVVEEHVVYGDSTLAGAFEVVDGGHDDLVAGLNLPTAARFNQNFTLYLEVTNNGLNDIAAPLFLVGSPNGTPVGLAYESLLPGSTQEQVMALGEVRPGILAPGESVSVPLLGQAVVEPNSQIGFTHLEADNLPLDWDSLESYYRDTSPDAEWAATWTALKSRVGDTWGDLHNAMREAAGAMAADGDTRYLGGSELMSNLLAQAHAQGQAAASAPAPVLAALDNPIDGALDHTFDDAAGISPMGLIDGDPIPLNPLLLAALEAAESYLDVTAIPALTAKFGATVGGMWLNFLHTNSSNQSATFTFGDGDAFVEGNLVATGYKNSATTVAFVSQVLQDSKLAIMQKLRDGIYTADTLPASIPITDLLKPEMLDSSHDPKGIGIKAGLNFSNPYDIPGNTAGGVGQWGSAPWDPATVDDTRSVSGNILVKVVKDECDRVQRVELSTALVISVTDALDFVPGDLGTGLEQVFTRPMRLLEENDWAGDVPFEVTYTPASQSDAIPGSSKVLNKDKQADPQPPSSCPGTGPTDPCDKKGGPVPPQSPDCDEDSVQNVPTVRPRDPNDIIGPQGFGEEHWTGGQKPLPYTIRFENQASATAPAQEVTITHPLDSDLNPSSFRLGDFGWGDIVVSVPEGMPFYTDRIDLRETLGFMVNVVAGIDVAKREAFWTFTTIDPATGEIPANPLVGFLPANVEKGTGEGFVNYTIRPKADTATGTVVDAQATIVFTTQEPIDTPPIFNTLDAQAPSSQVEAGADTAGTAQFLVRWTGTDTGSAIAGYTVYVADNGGEYAPWLENTALTEATFQGQPGHSYSFYTVATDNAGNIEAVPTEPGLTVRVAADAALADLAAPTLAALVPPPDGLYADGQNLDIQVRFSEPVFVDSATLPPSIALALGGGTAIAAYLSGSGTDTLLFRHVVAAGEFDPDGIGIGGTIDLNGGNIRDESGTPVLDLGIAPGPTPGIKVDNAPTVAEPLADQEAAEDSAFGFAVPASAFADTDGTDVLTYTATLADGSPLPQWLGFAAGTRTFSGTPLNADVGGLTIKVTATDSAGASASDQFTLVVANVNDAPTLDHAISDLAATEDQAFAFTVPPDAFSDVDAGDSLGYTATLADGSPLPQWLGFAAGTRTFSGTPLNADVGSLDIKITATDNAGTSASDQFILAIANVNDAPTVDQGIGDQSTLEDQPFAFSPPANAFADVDAGDALSYTATRPDGTALPAWLGFDADTLEFTGTPDNSEVGRLSVRVTATDGAGASVFDDFDLTVQNVNDVPAVNVPLPDAAATEDTAFGFAVPDTTFIDVDAGNRFGYAATRADGSALPAWLNFDATTLDFAGIPAQADVGSLTVRLTATDSVGASVFDEFTVVVANVNDAPTGSVKANGTATQNQTLTASDTLGDADGLGAITYHWLRGGADTGLTGKTYALTQADVGKAIAVRAAYTDGYGTAESVLSAATAPVANVNDAPSLANPIADQAATEDGLFGFVVPTNVFADIDPGDTLIYTAVLASGAALPGWLSFDPSTRTFAGTPLNADVGGLEIAVVATDGAGAQASDTFALAVANTNDAPTTADAAPMAVRDGAYTFGTGDFPFADPDIGDTFQALKIASLPLEGLLTLGGSPVAVGQAIPLSELDAGRLAYQAPTAIAGDWVQRFDFQVGDGLAFSADTGQFILELVPTSAAKLGGDGGDRMKGKAKSDLLVGNGGDDSLMGNGGNDRLYGGDGGDSLKGGVGRDYLSGGDGNDQLFGQAGKDTLVGGAGDDTLNGGSGKDIYLYLAKQLGLDDLQAGSHDAIRAGKGDILQFDETLWAGFHKDGAPLAGDGALSSNIDAGTNIAFDGNSILIDVNGDGLFQPDQDAAIELLGVHKVAVHGGGDFLSLG